MYRSLPAEQPFWGYYKKLRLPEKPQKLWAYTFLLQPVKRDQRENTALAALRNRLTVTAAPGVWNKPKGMV